MLDNWAEELARLKQQAEVTIEMPIIHMNEDALLALVAGTWKTYAMLQALVAAGIVTEQWASRSLRNVIQYTYRQYVCRCVTAYLDKRVDDEFRAKSIAGIFTAFGVPDTFWSDDFGV